MDTSLAARSASSRADSRKRSASTATEADDVLVWGESAGLDVAGTVAEIGSAAEATGVSTTRVRVRNEEPV